MRKIKKVTASQDDRVGWVSSGWDSIKVKLSLLFVQGRLFTPRQIFIRETQLFRCALFRMTGGRAHKCGDILCKVSDIRLKHCIY